MSRLSQDQLRALFPEYQPEDFLDTSDPTSFYNCIAWAAHQTDAWWEPTAGYYWPSEAPPDHLPSSLVSAFTAIGYTECETSLIEDCFDKIALYASDDEWLHAARQKPNGKWTSKLGQCQDIEHSSPESIICQEYGRIHCLMKKPRTS